jgi:DNA-binding response OmpR family regulator
LRAEGYEVLRAADGLAALQLHAKHEPALVILDWMLPKLDGLEVLRQIRQSAPTPVLMLTARTEETDRVVGLEVGADDYLTKPFGMRELIARVHALLRRIERVQAIREADREPEREVLRYAGLTLDPQGYQALMEGASLELTRTEFDLLHLLLRNPGRVFSRNYLLDTVWEQNYIAGDRSVDNAILRLRKKLGPLGEAIESGWGVGYRLRSS